MDPPTVDLKAAGQRGFQVGRGEVSIVPNMEVSGDWQQGAPPGDLMLISPECSGAWARIWATRTAKPAYRMGF